jgi:hypothetical protein
MSNYDLSEGGGGTSSTRWGGAAGGSVILLDDGGWGTTSMLHGEDSMRCSQGRPGRSGQLGAEVAGDLELRLEKTAGAVAGPAKRRRS